MAKSEEISDLSGNLAKMSVSHKYSLNLKTNFTKCGICSFDIVLTKDALTCTCTLESTVQEEEGNIFRQNMEFFLYCDSLDSFIL